MQVDSWQLQLQRAIRDSKRLGDALGLPLPEVATDFPMLVPDAFLSRMKPGDPEDPLLLQVLPRPEEQEVDDHYVADPLQEVTESESSTTPTGLIQKYQGRVLIVATGACAVNCRYCFRRHFPYESQQPDQRRWDEIISYIAADSSIREVILSGGDPLVMNDRQLSRITRQLSAIPHVDNLRIHTRLPIVIPDRICDDLLSWIGELNIPLVLVTHINHPAEIDDAVVSAMAKLKQQGVTLLNQSVLLRQVNNCAETLSELSRKLFHAGVLPYYLHLFDPVAGAKHFDISEADAVALMQELQTQLPGYLLPSLVREVPGTASKQLRF